MKENIGFVLTFTAMMVTILVLHGCTRYDTKDRNSDRWNITVLSTDTECSVSIAQDVELIIEDDSFELSEPKGSGS